MGIPIVTEQGFTGIWCLDWHYVHRNGECLLSCSLKSIAESIDKICWNFSIGWCEFLVWLFQSLTQSLVRKGLLCRPLKDMRSWQSDIFLSLSKATVNRVTHGDFISWISSLRYLSGRSLAFSTFPQDVASRNNVEDTEYPMLFKPWVIYALITSPLPLWKLSYSLNWEIISESNTVVTSVALFIWRNL